MYDVDGDGKLSKEEFQTLIKYEVVLPYSIDTFMSQI